MTDQVLTSTRFYGMHKLPVEFEMRPPAAILPMDKIRQGLRSLDITPMLFERPPTTIMTPGGLEPGQVMVPIKMLGWLNPHGGDKIEATEEKSPVFFFAFMNYTSKLEDYRTKLEAFYGSLDSLEEFKLSSILEVSVGGIFIIKGKLAKYYYRIRVTKINLTRQKLQYWALDEAFYGKCGVNDLLNPNDFSMGLDMLAIPGVFETKPSAEQLETLEKSYSMAKVTHPKFAFDFCPRKISLI